MRIADGIEMLQLPVNGGSHYMNPTLIYDEHAMVLVDTGLPGHYDAINELISRAGREADHLNTIILSHQDIDHIGSLPQFLLNSRQRPVTYAHDADKPYMEGELPLIKAPEERVSMLLAQLPSEAADQFRAIFSKATPSNISHSLTDGQWLPFGGGITVVYTPGHTPGHVSLYHHNSKTLIAADAMNVQEGKLVGPNPNFTPDMNLALRSLGKFAAYDIATVICYHGGIFSDNPNDRIAELAAQAD